MPDDSSGNYSVPAGTLVNTGDTVLPSQHNPWANDSSTAISNRFSKDGRAPATGNWNLNGFRITQLGAPSASSDATTKTYVDTAITAVNSSQPKIENLAANRLALAADKGTSFRFSGNRTLTLQPAATLGNNWWCEAWSKSGIVTVDPDASETIEGATQMLLQTGERCIIFCTGTLFYAISASTSYSGPQLQGYVFGLGTSTNATDPTNDIDVAAGAIASSASPYDLIQVAAITKRIDAAWAVGNNQGGLDTGSVGNNTYFVIPIRRPDTGVTDVLISLSATSPTMPANYTQKGAAIATFTRAAGVNGPITWLTTQAIGVGQNISQPTRVGNQVYVNSTGRPIKVYIRGGSGTSGGVDLSSDGTNFFSIGAIAGSSQASISFDVPNGWSYRANTTSIAFWTEVR